MPAPSFVDDLKTYWDNPMNALVTEPLGMVAKSAYWPARPFILAFKDALPPKNNMSFLGRLSAKCWDHFLAFLAGPIAASTGAVVAAYGVGSIVMGAGSSILLALPAAAAAGAGAFFAAPIVAVAGLMLTGAAVGLGLLPYAYARGAAKIIHHIRHRRDTENIQAKVPALKAANDDVVTKAIELFKAVEALPKELHAPVMVALHENFARSETGTTQKIIRSLEALPQGQKMEFVRHLRGLLAVTFEKVAVAEALDATTLARRIKPLGIVKFAPKKDAETADTPAPQQSRAQP